jgi:predicted transposase/invertase (TIGR01784 family)
LPKVKFIPVLSIIESDNLTPEERRVAKIAAATEETRKLVERQAKAEGQKEGEMKANLENAQKMFAKGFDTETIAEITGLDAETLNQLEMAIILANAE